MIPTLWFDVGFKRYTTQNLARITEARLWFDVGFKRYTTALNCCLSDTSCGLM